MLKNAFNKGLAEGRSFSDTLLSDFRITAAGNVMPVGSQFSLPFQLAEQQITLGTGPTSSPAHSIIEADDPTDLTVTAAVNGVRGTIASVWNRIEMSLTDADEQQTFNVEVFVDHSDEAIPRSCTELFPWLPPSVVVAAIMP